MSPYATTNIPIRDVVNHLFYALRENCRKRLAFTFYESHPRSTIKSVSRNCVSRIKVSVSRYPERFECGRTRYRAGKVLAKLAVPPRPSCILRKASGGGRQKRPWHYEAFTRVFTSDRSEIIRTVISATIAEIMSVFVTFSPDSFSAFFSISLLPPM